jgi:hypothetical protein
MFPVTVGAEISAGLLEEISHIRIASLSVRTVTLIFHLLFLYKQGV